MRLASGGDDGIARVWSLNQKGRSVVTIDGRANVCSVQVGFTSSTVVVEQRYMYSSDSWFYFYFH